MIKEYNALQTYLLKAGSSFVRPVQKTPERVKLSDQATIVMTDLSTVTVVSVRANTSMDNANAKMIRYGVRLLLVLDENDQVAGGNVSSWQRYFRLWHSARLRFSALPIRVDGS